MKLEVKANGSTLMMNGDFEVNERTARIVRTFLEVAVDFEWPPVQVRTTVEEF